MIGQDLSWLASSMAGAVVLEVGRVRVVDYTKEATSMPPSTLVHAHPLLGGRCDQTPCLLL